MRRNLNLRQIEAFKAVIENGTVSRAAEVLNISQPGMSKLIAHLEQDTGLTLFDRIKGRLAPTESAMALHKEIDRIFAGVRQVENAVEDIRRAQQGRLAIGVMPALADSFIQQATKQFREDHPSVFCSVQMRSSQFIVNWLIDRKLDIGIVGAAIANPYVELEPLMERPLVCIMPPGNPLAEKSHIEPSDLDGIAYVGFNSDTYIGRKIETTLDSYKISANTIIVSNVASTICQFVAMGLGVSLMHPLMASGFRDRLIAKPFLPEVLENFQICRLSDNRNGNLVDEFSESLRATGEKISKSMLGE